MTSTVPLVGNVTRDPALRFTPGGQATAGFGLAVNRRRQNRQTNEWEESTSFFDVVCRRELAEKVAESVQRGSRVIVVGRMDQRTQETTEGDKRSRAEVVADEVGPSLRWATAEVKKRTPSDGDAANSSATSTAPAAPVVQLQGAPAAAPQWDDAPAPF